MSKQKVEIGTFNKMERSTFADCARITFWELSNNGMYYACVIDGILYIFRMYEDGTSVIICANSSFDLTIL